MIATMMYDDVCVFANVLRVLLRMFGMIGN